MTSIRNKRLLFAVLGAAVVAVLAACGGGTSSEREQPLGLGVGSAITWLPSSIALPMNPGGRQDIPVTFTTTAALTNVSVTVVPELRSLVSVTPASFATLQPGQTATVTLSVSAGATAALGTTDGTVRLVSGTSTIAKPLSVAVSLVAPESINGASVPPEPPADLNNATLAGFDTNGNGVRDDVERYLANDYASSTKARLSLMQRAAALQKALTSDDHATTKLLLDAARDCMAASFSANASDADGARRSLAATTALISKVMNTINRIRAYAIYNQSRNGTVTTLTPYENTASRCLARATSASN